MSMRTLELCKNIGSVNFIKVPKIESSEPVITVCPHCNSKTITNTKKTNGCTIWVSAIFCFVFSGGICCCAPCCCNELKDTAHMCSQCGNLISITKRHQSF